LFNAGATVANLASCSGSITVNKIFCCCMDSICICLTKVPVFLCHLYLEEKRSGSGLENLSLSLYPQKLALTLLTSGGRSLGIVRSRTKSHGVCL
jgi:hypothetical protein